MFHKTLNSQFKTRNLKTNLTIYFFKGSLTFTKVSSHYFRLNKSVLFLIIILWQLLCQKCLILIDICTHEIQVTNKRGENFKQFWVYLS